MGARRLVFVAVALLAAGAVTAGLVLSSSNTGRVSAVAAGSAVGQPAPIEERPSAPELEGAVLVPPAVRLADLRGKPALVNFWASWCIPCRKEAPELARFDSTMSNRAQLVGVDIQDTKADALAFVHKFGWSFPNLYDPAGVLAPRYGLIGLPTTTYVIDPQGRIAYQLTGPQTLQSLQRAVETVE